MFTRKRIILLIIAIILIVFIIINAYWYFIVHNYFLGFTETKAGGKIPKDPVGSYSKIIDGYYVGVEPPKYLVMSSNLSISKVDSSDTDPYLIIWPEKYGETIFGISLTENDVSYQFYVKQNGELEKNTEGKTLSQDQAEELQQLLDENKKYIKGLIDIANTTWNFE